MSEDISKDIKQIYHQDIKEKKQTGRSVHNRTGKQGRVGTMRTPADLLTGKERREYEGTTPVTTSNIYHDQDYERILSLEEFKKLSKNRKMLVLDAYKRKYTASQLSKHWNITIGGVHYYYRAYGVSKRTLARKEDEQASRQPILPKTTTSAIASQAASGNDGGNGARPEGECNFMAVGEFGADSLCRKLQGLSYMLNDSLRYQVEIRVKEVPGRT